MAVTQALENEGAAEAPLLLLLLPLPLLLFGAVSNP